VDASLDRLIAKKRDLKQTAIAAVLTDMDATLGGLEQRRDKTRALKQGMIQEHLTRRKRLL
jgi:type I restriction enzyme S subunit